MNPPLDLADVHEGRFQRIPVPAQSGELHKSSAAPTSNISPLNAVERARVNENPSIKNTRVRQLTALVAEFATHEEVLGQTENYREALARNPEDLVFDSPVSRDLSIYRLLGHEETRELGYRIDDGLDAYNGTSSSNAAKRIVGAVAAHQTIVVCNVRFVNHLANFYNRVTPASREQIYAWGLSGLLHAAKKYNASLNYRFTTFARNEIKDAIHKQIRKERRQQDLGGLLVLNENVSDDSETEFIETLPDALSAPPEEEFFQGMDPVIEIINGMNLSPKDRSILLDLASGLTVREIADKMDVKRQGIYIKINRLRPLIATAFGRLAEESKENLESAP